MPRLVAFALCLPLVACAGLGHHDAVESADILDRQTPAARTEVKHILLGWKWLDSTYRKMGLTLDARAQDRTQTAAEELARTLLERLRKGEPIEPLMKEFSEDEASAQGGIAIPVTADVRLVPEFKDLALRLNVGESGIVRSTFGLHVMQRVK